jgi:heterodisulfide reductase subunit A2
MQKCNCKVRGMRGQVSLRSNKIEPNKAAQVITASCHGCGTCVAECPQDALHRCTLLTHKILAQIRAALEKDPEDKILAILCNWCSYAGADLAGTSRFEYPLASGRYVLCAQEELIATSYLKLCDLALGMVLIGACHLPYDCHYISGNYKMKARTDALKGMLEKLGMSPAAFQSGIRFRC